MIRRTQSERDKGSSINDVRKGQGVCDYCDSIPSTKLREVNHGLTGWKLHKPHNKNFGTGEGGIQRN